MAAGLEDCTHVVLRHRQQPCYAEAAAAGKPAFSAVWPYACAEAGRLLPALLQVGARPWQRSNTVHSLLLAWKAADATGAPLQ